MNPDYKYCPRCAAAFSLKPLGGKDRAHCESCGFTHWNNPTPVVAAIVQYGDDILLARNAAWPPKTFALITGFLEANETAQEGIAREVKEETNLEVVECNLVGVYEFHRKNELIIAFDVVASGEVLLSEELLEYKLLRPEKLRPWPGGTGKAVADWMTSKGLPFEVLQWDR